MPLHRLENINRNTLLGIWHIHEDEYFDWSSITHPNDYQNAQSISNPKPKRQRLASRALAKKCIEQLSEYYSGVSSKASGAPFLENSTLHISISHSYDFAAVLISNKAVGIDIQKLTSNMQNIVPRVCSDKECVQFTTQKALGIVWSAKEALYKKYSDLDLSLKMDIEIKNISSDKVEATINHDAVQELETVQYELFEDYILGLSL